MGFQIDGVDVTTVQFNGVDIDEVQLDGVSVWTSEVPPVELKDIFGIDLWDGVGLVGQDIVNGIDATTNDTLVWIKARNAAHNHNLYDTLRGEGNYLISNETTASTFWATTLTEFNDDGYSLGDANIVNQTATTYVGWTFRKAAKFFDVIEYVGDGIAGREIPHSLGVQAGMCFVKRTSTADWWFVQQVDIGGTHYGQLQDTPAFTDSSSVWNNTTMDATNVTLGSGGSANGNDVRYIMYVFAHDPSPEGLIQCGQYTGNGNLVGTIVELGWTPQYVMIKRATGGSSNWTILDTTRGIGISNDDNYLIPNENSAEAATNILELTDTGFQIVSSSSWWNANGSDYIYMAVREFPPPPPVVIEDVFGIDLWTGNSVSQEIVNGVDAITNDTLVWIKARTNADNNLVFDTLRGAGAYLITNENATELTNINMLSAFNEDGYSLGAHSTVNQNGIDFVGWTFRQSQRFFDVIEYVGDSVTGREIPHSLGIKAGLCLVKNIYGGNSWCVQHINLGGEQYLTLNLHDAAASSVGRWNDTAMTETTVTLGNNGTVNNSGNNYIMYVFAHDDSPDGVIQCGSYFGTLTTVGPVIELGWKPQFIMLKRATDSAGNWHMFDTSRGMVPNEASNQTLYPDTTSADVLTTGVDLTPTGFKITTSSTVFNAASEYVYIAIREG